MIASSVHEESKGARSCLLASKMAVKTLRDYQPHCRGADHGSNTTSPSSYLAFLLRSRAQEQAP